MEIKLADEGTTLIRGDQHLRLVDSIYIEGEANLLEAVEGAHTLGYSMEVKIVGLSDSKTYQKYELTLLSPIQSE